MIQELKLPVDICSLPPFRRLKAIFGSPSKAMLTWVILYRELAYAAQNNAAPGHFPAKDRDMIEGEIAREAQLSVDESAGLMDRLIEVELVKRDGDDYFCSRFIEDHTGVAVGKERSKEARGGDMRSFRIGAKKAQEDAFQLGLRIAGEKYTDPATGEKMSSEMVQRVNRLIRCADLALFKNNRPDHGFTEGLICDAAMVLKGNTDAEIDILLQEIVKKRGHPLLQGFTAEKLLPMFNSIIPKLNGQANE